MTSPQRKSLMRNLGEFVGHIWKGVRSGAGGRKHVLRRDVQEEKRGEVTLRRTTIEEIEFRETGSRGQAPRNS